MEALSISVALVGLLALGQSIAEKDLSGAILGSVILALRGRDLLVNIELSPDFHQYFFDRNDHIRPVIASRAGAIRYVDQIMASLTGISRPTSPLPCPFGALVLIR